MYTKMAALLQPLLRDTNILFYCHGCPRPPITVLFIGILYDKLSGDNVIFPNGWFHKTNATSHILSADISLIGSQMYCTPFYGLSALWNDHIMSNVKKIWRSFCRDFVPLRNQPQGKA